MEAYNKRDIDAMSAETRYAVSPQAAVAQNVPEQSPCGGRCQQSHSVPCYVCAHNMATSHVVHHPVDPRPSAANVVPVPLLSRWPALVECPSCREVLPTTMRHEAGKGTHWMAVCFFFTTGVGVFLPYAMNHFKDAQHSCARCGRKLATQRFGGATKAHLM